MRVLIADDDLVLVRILEATLVRWGYEPLTTRDGLAAWQVLQQADAPRIALLDWMMPGLSGVEICQRLRGRSTAASPYLILLTGRDLKEDMQTAFKAGADDFLVKPFEPEELRARFLVACKVVDLQRKLADRELELQSALARIRQLEAEASMRFMGELPPKNLASALPGSLLTSPEHETKASPVAFTIASPGEAI